MAFDVIANEPAGRLRDVLSVVRAVPGNVSLSSIWESAAATLIPARGDMIAVRAEAGALYNSVETAINAMPIERDREAFRAYRFSWARPIFGIGLVDANNHQMSGEAIVTPDAINTLSMLSTTLRHESPEPSSSLTGEELRQNLEAVFDQLGRIHMEVSTATWFDRRARSRLLTLITESMDNIVFVDLRGIGRLEQSTLTIEGELVASESQLAVPGSAPEQLRQAWHERVSYWLSVIRPIVRDVREMVEYDVVPFATGVSVGLSTGDVVAALGAWLGSRVALEGRHPAPPINAADRKRALPRGAGADETGADSTDTPERADPPD